MKYVFCIILEALVYLFEVTEDFYNVALEVLILKQNKVSQKRYKQVALVRYKVSSSPNKDFFPCFSLNIRPDHNVFQSSGRLSLDSCRLWVKPIDPDPHHY